MSSDLVFFVKILPQQPQFIIVILSIEKTLRHYIEMAEWVICFASGISSRSVAFLVSL